MSVCDIPCGGTASRRSPAHLPDRSQPNSHYFRSSQPFRHVYPSPPLCPCCPSRPQRSCLPWQSSHLCAAPAPPYLQPLIEVILRLLHCLICRSVTLYDGALLPPRVKPGSDDPLRHSFSSDCHHLPTGVPSHFIHTQNAGTIPLHLLCHLGTLARLEHCPYVPLPDLNTHFRRQQFRRQFKRHSLPCTPTQLGIDILYLCILTAGRSCDTSFGFCNKQGFTGAGY